MIEAPDLSLAALAPLLFVFGAACIGVLVEAFGPRNTRHPIQVAVALVGTLGALVTTVLLAGTREVTAAGALAVDGAALFLQATIAGLGALSLLLFAERSLDPARSAFVTSAAVPAGSPRDREQLTSERVQTEVYPLATFAIGGMMLFVSANDLLVMFVALEVLSLPLYLLCGLARRRRLLSQEAAVKYFLLGAFTSAFFLYGLALVYGATGQRPAVGDPGGRRRRRRQHPAGPRPGAARRRAALQSQRRAVPHLDAGRLRGRPDAGHRVHGRLHEGRRVRGDPAAALRRRSVPASGPGGR